MKSPSEIKEELEHNEYYAGWNYAFASGYWQAAYESLYFEACGLQERLAALEKRELEWQSRMAGVSPSGRIGL